MKHPILEKFNLGDQLIRKINITDSVMNSFASLSTDYSRIHTDENFAKGHGFSGRVVYGNILGFLISALVGMDLGSQDVMIISQSINFKKPVYVNDTIQLNAAVFSKSEAVGVVEFKLTFTNTAQIKVANGFLQVKCL